MRQTVLFIGIACFSMSLLSCSKEIESVKPLTSVTNSTLKTSNWMKYNFDIGHDEWCDSPGVNCGPTVTATPSIEALEELHDAILKGSEGISGFFKQSNKDTWSQIFPTIAKLEDVLKELRSGQYTIEEIRKPNSVSTYIFRIYSLDNTNSYGYPVILATN